MTKSTLEISPEHLWDKLASLAPRLPFLAAVGARFPQSKIYLVGGAVRDLLLKRETQDFDFLVRHVPADALGKLLRQYGKVSWVGKQFGIYKFYAHDQPFEPAIDVALPRTEASFSHTGAYRDFEVRTDPDLPVEADLKRRDFTINAMAVDLKKKSLIDPYNGIADLQSGCLRAVGNPSQRFSEDSTRLLRGLRLAAQLQLGFEDESWAALKQLMGKLNAIREAGAFVVPRETIAKEFIKAMLVDPVRSFDLWDKSGAFAALIPELLPMKGCPQPKIYHAEGDVWTHTRLALSQLMSQEYRQEFGDGYDAETVLAVLFHDIGKPRTIQTPEDDGVDRIRFNNHDQVGADLVKIIAKRLKLSSLQKGSPDHVDEGRLTWLVRKHLILVHGQIEKMRAATIERTFLNPQHPGKKLLQLIFCDGMATIPEKGQIQISHYHLIKDRIAGIEALSAERAKIPAPLVNGREVMDALKIPSGPRVGKYLSIIREEQLLGRLSSKAAAIAFLKESQCDQDQ
ncbi:MAG: CCA tRNA nucleotidyltransferase [Nitrospiria bacterium]